MGGASGRASGLLRSVEPLATRFETRTQIDFASTSPKEATSRVHTQTHLNAVARELDGRPRQTLGWMTPSQVFSEALAATG